MLMVKTIVLIQFGDLKLELSITINLNQLSLWYNYGNLLSYKTCVELGIMAKINAKINVNGTMKEKVKEKFIRKYPLLFSGKVGMLKDHQVNLHIDESIRPIQQKLRPVPFHLRPLVELKL